MRQVLFFIATVLMLGVLIFLVATLPDRVTGLKEHGRAVLAQGQIDYANKLLSKGLKEQAAEAYEEYLVASRMLPQEEAKILYKLGGIYMETYKYEKALKNFFKAEMVDPKSEFAQEMNQKVVEALENLGMGSQARYELEARTSLGGGKEIKGKALARIGKREIADTEIDQAMKTMPEWMKKSFEEPQKRLEFIRDYVAREVLYGKAKLLGFDTKEGTRQALEQVKKQIVVNELLRKEISEKMDKISPEDVKLYYDANKEKWFDKKENKQRGFEEVRSDVEREYVMKKEQEIGQAMLNKALEEQEVEIFFKADNNEIKKDK